MTTELKVTQADRDAAANYVRDNQQPRLEQNVRAGKAYVGLSEAFAKVRLAERERIVAYLRAKGDADLADSKTANTSTEGLYLLRGGAAHELADSIERGDHEQGEGR